MLQLNFFLAKSLKKSGLCENTDGTIWGGDERVRAGLNRRPALFLRRGRRAELLLEPAGDDGMKRETLHDALAYFFCASFH